MTILQNPLTNKMSALSLMQSRSPSPTPRPQSPSPGPTSQFVQTINNHEAEVKTEVTVELFLIPLIPDPLLKRLSIPAHQEMVV